MHMCICRYTVSIAKGTVGSINISPGDRKSNKVLIWGKQLFLPWVSCQLSFLYLLGWGGVGWDGGINHTQMASKWVQNSAICQSERLLEQCAELHRNVVFTWIHESHKSPIICYDHNLRGVQHEVVWQTNYTVYMSMLSYTHAYKCDWIAIA